MGDSGFSFVRNNAARIAGLPRYAIGALRSTLTRRDPRLWVIGSHFGLRDGAWAFYQAARAADPGLRLIWLVSTEDQARQARERGVEWCPRDTRAGFDWTLRAGVVALTHGFGDANRYGQSGAVIVQLWHGMPLKKLHADSPAIIDAGPLSRVPGASCLVKTMFQRGNSRISLLPVASPAFVGSMCSAFTLTPDQVRVTGEPRTDVLFTGSPDERRLAARALLESRLGPLGDRRVLLYAPTWRDGEADPSVPTPAQWQRIEDYLDQVDGLLIVRPHPLGVGDYTHTSDRVRLLTASQQPDSMPLLWGLDGLISDYSSMFFDAAATGMPLFFLAPDVEHYSQTRGLYIDYADFTDGAWEVTWDGVLDRLRRFDADADERARVLEHSKRLAARYHTHTDGRSATRVVARVQELLRHA